MIGERAQWQAFEWRYGGKSYSFELSPHRERAALSIENECKLELPMGAWRALLDAIGMEQREGTRARWQPARAGAPWTEDEDRRLTAAFRTGRLLSTMAREHGRSEVAIASRLVILGLAHRGEFPHLNRGHIPVGEEDSRPAPHQGSERPSPADSQVSNARAGSGGSHGADAGSRWRADRP
jgi:hypothetical protein